MSSEDSRPGFWRRLGRAFVVFLKVALLILVLVAIGLGAWYGYQALTRSMADTVDRTEANARRIELLRSDVDNLMADTANEEVVATLQAEVTALEAEVEANRTALADDLDDQQEMLVGLQLQVARLVTGTLTQGEEINRLQEGILALQEDINDNTAMVDELGGAIDQVEADMTALAADFAVVREEAGELAQMQRTLTLFRIWELLSRARLHLLEGNAGLAEADVATALASVNSLIALDGEAVSPELLALQQRLELAAENLPTDPETAGRDLQTAWEMLDQLLATSVGIEALEMTPTLTGTLPLTNTTPVTPTTTVTPTPSTP